MTLITDYTLAGVTAWLAWLLIRKQEGHASRSYWAVAFAAVAFSATLGGSFHGFAPELAESAQNLLWKATVLVVGVGTFAMVVGSSIGTTSGTPRKVLISLATAKLVIYLTWMVSYDDFSFVIVDTGITMAVIGLLHGWSTICRRDPASIWMIGGVGVSALAAGVQSTGYAPHPHFNHNDLYHVIQIAAMVLFYMGARQLRDKSQLAESR